MAPDPIALRRAFGAFPTGVTVVTTRDGSGTPRGFTANSFTSVSLDPPMLLVCVARSAASCAVFAGAGGFAVTVLSRDQQPVSALFASKAPDKFAQAAWHDGALALPLIAGGTAWFACARAQTIEAGDHIILLGHVLEFGATPDEPLGYCRGAYVDFELSQKAVSALGRRVRVEAILEQEGSLVLLRGPDGTLALPAGAALGPASASDSLLGSLAAHGVAAQLDFLFAVFERLEPALVSIAYRGSATGARPGGAVELHALDAVPLGRVADPATAAMIARFVREHAAGFGIYVGDESAGTVHTLALEKAP